MKIQDIIKELIEFEENSVLPSFMKERKENIDLNIIESIVRDLLFWQKSIFRRNARGKILEMSIFNQTEYFIRHHDSKDYENLLTSYEELHKIFSIKHNIITLNPAITEPEIS